MRFDNGFVLVRNGLCKGCLFADLEVKGVDEFEMDGVMHRVGEPYVECEHMQACNRIAKLMEVRRADE